MIGTQIAEDLVQAVALSHLVKGQKRVSLLLLAAPESGKTTITSAASCKHVRSVAVISGRSVLSEATAHPEMEYLLFNDMSGIRAMSHAAVNLLVVILNQFTQDERGIVAFAGKSVEEITRPIGIIGCLPFDTFKDHRSTWREMGFISRMIPFAYEYGDELVAEIKDAIDSGNHSEHTHTRRKLPAAKRAVTIAMPSALTRELRRIADAKSKSLGQLGIRLLQNYHCLIRSHALLCGRRTVTKDDLLFLRAVDRYVSITQCEPLTDRRR